MELTARRSFVSDASRVLARFRELGILFVTVLVSLGVGLYQPAFLTPNNMLDILLDVAITIIVAVGQMMVIVTRGIDLSVGSVVGLVGMSVGLTIRDRTDFPMVAAVLMGTGLGLALGCLNGLIVTKGKVPPIITTLGTLSVFRGMVIVISKGQWVDAYRLPRSFFQITRRPMLGVPALVIYAALAAVFFHLFLRHTRAGRDIFTVGSNPAAAAMEGIAVERVHFLVFALSGALSGLGGVLWASRFASVVNDMGSGFELTTVAACVLGGVNVYGGSGSVLGVVLGAIFLGIVSNALTITGIPPFWRLTVQGLVILLAVVVDAVISRRVVEVWGGKV